MKWTKRLFLFIVCAISVTTTIFANSAEKPWWVSAGTGNVTGKDSTDSCTRIYSFGPSEACRDLNDTLINGYNFLLSYNYAPKNNQVFSINYVQVDYSEFLGGLFGSPTDTGYINAISIEYGLIQRWRYGHFLATLGPAYVDSRGAHNDRELIPPPPHSSIGISGKLEIGFTPFRYVGFALSAVGDYNKNMPYYGVFLSLQIGNFNP